ncbi:MAG TPA: type II toxin-antitoxin system VapC family toxin [Candidatus Dormibacteraeota bacterium]|nr:type II toxin-antitoxin system VapC family toxin [Candidatus Dormibacteraeota bacterium]
MRVLVDTNILLRSAQPNHPLFSQSVQAVTRLIRGQESVFFCSQNIAEFWNVATRPSDRNGLGLSAEEALEEVANIEKSLTLLPDVPAIYAEWKRIVSSHRVQGVKVYDARLVAIMNVYAVENLLTFNTGDFERFKNVRAIQPASFVA